MFQVNVLNHEFGADVRAAFAELQDSAETKSIVLISAKPGCFIAGADIKMLAATKEQEAIKALAVGKISKVTQIDYPVTLPRFLVAAGKLPKLLILCMFVPQNLQYLPHLD